MSEPGDGGNGNTAPDRTEPRSGKLLTRLVVLGVIVGGAWAAHRLTTLAEVPYGVRVYRTSADALETHANAVRAGQIEPESDPNKIARYPLSDELRRAGVSVCIVRDGVIWYHLPSGALDAGSPCLVTPLDRTEPVTKLPARLSRGVYQFSTLHGNWAFWFAV